jgi:hypothetical protein
MRLIFSWLFFVFLLALIIVALPLRNLLHLGGDIGSFLFTLGILGALLVIVAAGAKTGRWLRFFFILTGASALGWPVGLWLHNILIKVWSTEPITYVLVFYILPLTFVTGVLGTVITGIARAISHLGRR